MNAPYTVEISWYVPSGMHVTIEAESPEVALAEANRRIEAGEVDYDHQKEWGDASTSTVVSGLWLGERSPYVGDDLRSPSDLLATDLAIAREVAPKAIEAQTEALIAAESFISGFEGDELQEGIDELLATIRAAIGGAS